MERAFLMNKNTLFLIKFHEKEGVFIYTERYSDFNSMIEQYEKEMRRLFEESRRANGDFLEPAAETAVFPQDYPEVPELRQTEQEEPEILVPEKTKAGFSKEKNGKIIVEVTTGKGAVPLSGVTVIIDRFDSKDPMGRKELVAVRETNRSGRTETVMVSAAERELSLEPGSADPFSTYYVSAGQKGFVPVKDRPTDVFSGEVAILKIDLIPMPENLSGEGTVNG